MNHIIFYSCFQYLAFNYCDYGVKVLDHCCGIHTCCEGTGLGHPAALTFHIHGTFISYVLLLGNIIFSYTAYFLIFT
jgi:hypothetical protein